MPLSSIDQASYYDPDTEIAGADLARVWGPDTDAPLPATLVNNTFAQDILNAMRNDPITLSSYQAATTRLKESVTRFEAALRQALTEAWTAGNILIAIRAILGQYDISFRKWLLSQDIIGYATAYRLLGLASGLSLSEIESAPPMTLTAAYALAAVNTPTLVRSLILDGNAPGQADSQERITEEYVSQIRELYHGPSWLWTRWRVGSIPLGQAYKTVKLLPSLSSEVLAIVRTWEVFNPDVIGLLNNMSLQVDDKYHDLINELQVAGHLQGGEHPPIPLNECTVRDFATYFDEERRARVSAKLAEIESMIIRVPATLRAARPMPGDQMQMQVVMMVTGENVETLLKALNDPRPLTETAIAFNYGPKSKDKPKAQVQEAQEPPTARLSQDAQSGEQLPALPEEGPVRQLAEQYHEVRARYQTAELREIAGQPTWSISYTVDPVGGAPIAELHRAPDERAGFDITPGISGLRVVQHFHDAPVAEDCQCTYCVEQRARRAQAGQDT